MASLDSHWTFICLLLYLTALEASATDVRDMSIDEYINYINPPALHKFVNKHGDNILCVEYTDQISLQGSEQRFMKSMHDREMKSELNFSSYGVRTNCPEGTVAVMETKREQVERAGSVAHFISKTRNFARSSKDLSTENEEHEYAGVEFKTSERIGGAEAGLNVWQPDVDTGNGGIFSLAQISVINDREQTETAEVGWAAEGSTGCWNTFCPGFVLAPGAPIYPGAPLKPLSQYNGIQIQLLTTIVKEIVDGNSSRWSLYVAGKLIGWWPSSLFKNLASMANRVDLGGEVCFSAAPPGTPFSKTEMGSGHLPYEGFGRAANIRDIQILDYEGVTIDDISGTTYRGRPFCYDVSLVANTNSGTNIFFGGPGGNNPNCVV